MSYLIWKRKNDCGNENTNQGQLEQELPKKSNQVPKYLNTNIKWQFGFHVRNWHHVELIIRSLADLDDSTFIRSKR